MVHDDGFTVRNRKKSKVKWAPLEKKDVNRLIYGPKMDGAGPSVDKAGLEKTQNVKNGPAVGNGVQFGPVKPSEKASGLKLGGGTSVGLSEGSCLHQNATAVSVESGSGPIPALNDKEFPPLHSVGSKSKGPMKAMVENLREIWRGSGFFDISQNNFRPRQSTLVETKNSFDTLQNEEDCFDTEHGLWEKEMVMVRKFYETNTKPPDDVFSSWSEKLKTYYVMLTKIDPVKENLVETNVEDEVEVESETDESARDIARGVWFLGESP
ncbi:hypothetical protein Hdeb2414_s0004g00130571 [Helianthus debilis subsp. tardiflorus]